jgi:predicted dehydrogenase
MKAQRSAGAGTLAKTVNWGILGAARIAHRSFLPGLRETGTGRALMVAARDRERGQAFADAEGIDEVATTYEALLADARIDAVYVPLPNSLHAEWAERALAAGKAVLCEKPLGATLSATAEIVAAAEQHPGAPLWEAFVFPFQDQHLRVLQLLAEGAIGELQQVHSIYHYKLAPGFDIRRSAELGGGALADVGCYPIRLGHELLGPASGPVTAQGLIEDGVDFEAAGIVAHGQRPLVLSCGFRGPGSNPETRNARLLGSDGYIFLSSPFHPTPADTITIVTDSRTVIEHPTTDTNSFTAALRHIHAVVDQQEAPRQLATESALSTARTLDALQRALR